MKVCYLKVKVEGHEVPIEFKLASDGEILRIRHVGFIAIEQELVEPNEGHIPTAEILEDLV